MLVNKELRGRVIERRRLQIMFLIHMGYSRLIPQAIIDDIKNVSSDKYMQSSEGSKKYKAKIYLTDDIKETILEPVTKAMLEGTAHIDIYEMLIGEGFLNSNESMRPGYVTISRWITSMKKEIGFDIRPLYMKVKSRMADGLSDEQIAKVLGVNVRSIRRARSKLSYIEKQERLLKEKTNE